LVLVSIGRGWVIERNGKQLTKYRWRPVLWGNDFAELSVHHNDRTYCGTIKWLELFRIGGNVYLALMEKYLFEYF